MSYHPQFEKHYPRNSSDGQMGNRKRKRGVCVGGGGWVRARETEENKKWFIDIYIWNVYGRL